MPYYSPGVGRLFHCSNCLFPWPARHYHHWYAFLLLDITSSHPQTSNGQYIKWWCHSDAKVYSKQTWWNHQSTLCMTHLMVEKDLERNVTRNVLDFDKENIPSVSPVNTYCSTTVLIINLPYPIPMLEVMILSFLKSHIKVDFHLKQNCCKKTASLRDITANETNFLF